MELLKKSMLAEHRVQGLSTEWLANREIGHPEVEALEALRGETTKVVAVLVEMSEQTRLQATLAAKSESRLAALLSATLKSHEDGIGADRSNRRLALLAIVIAVASTLVTAGVDVAIAMGRITP